MYYCDKDCLESDWQEIHQFECELYANDKKNTSRYLENPCERLLIRFHLMKQSDPSFTTKMYTQHDGTERCFDELMAHEDEIRNYEEAMRNFNIILNNLKEAKFEYDYEDAFYFYCRLWVNSFKILYFGKYWCDIGSGIYTFNIVGFIMN